MARQAVDWQVGNVDQAELLAQVAELALKLLPGAVGTAVIRPRRSDRLELVVGCGALAEIVTAEFGALTGVLPFRGASAAPERPRGSGRASVHRRPGAGALVCVALGVGHPGFGTLVVSLGREHSPNHTARVQTWAAVLAAHASVALDGQRKRSNLEIALDTRDLIGQAKGILMERHRLTAEAAYDRLVELSSSTQTKLKDVAEQVAATGDVPAPRISARRQPHPVPGQGDAAEGQGSHARGPRDGHDDHRSTEPGALRFVR